jgi:hypothetical protein
MAMTRRQRCSTSDYFVAAIVYGFTPSRLAISMIPSYDKNKNEVTKMAQTNYVERELERYAQVERAWLRSINASAKQIPDDVAVAAFVRGYVQRFPDKARWLVEHLVSTTIISEALGGER